MNMHTPLDATPQLVALDQLYLHDMNPRQNGSDADTAAMAQSIAINGLMQNLMGYGDPAQPGKIGIVAGGRRLHALQQLQSEGSGLASSKEPDWDAIPVQVTDDAMLAQSWAGAESTTQRPLHPADEIRAYAAMADQGNSPDTIARAFAQTERHVQGRLALAGLTPEVLDALRANHISLDVAKALTLATTPERQLSVLTSARAGGWPARRVRHELTSDTVRSDDRKVRFITLALYLAEGGTMDSDLFEDHAYLHDSDLVDRLFTSELAVRAEALREAEGWSWVKTTESPYDAWDMTKGLTAINRTPGELPEGDLDDYQQLIDMAEEDKLTDQGRATLEELQSRLDGDYTDEDREAGGIIVLVNRNGELVTNGAYCEKSKSTKSDTGTAPGNTTTPKPALTQAGVSDLRRISLMALQGAMADKTKFVLDLFAWQMQRQASTHSSPFNITLADQAITPEAGELQTPARLADISNETKYVEGSEDVIASFRAFQDAGEKHRNAILTRHLVRTLQLPEGRMAPLGRLMVEFAGASIRKIWTPDGPTYFSRLSTQAMAAIWVELLELELDDPRITEFAKLKKAEKIKELAALFSDASAQEAHGLSRDQVAVIDAWLPPELRAIEG